MKIKTNKVVAIFFVALMSLSSLVLLIEGGVPIIKKILGVDEEFYEIPNQRILQYKLNPTQQRELLSRGYTLIEFTYPLACIECEQQKAKFEEYTQNSDNQIFLQEIVDNAYSSSIVIITSFRGEKTLTNSTIEEITSELCNLIWQKPLWCVQI